MTCSKTCSECGAPTMSEREFLNRIEALGFRPSTELRSTFVKGDVMVFVVSKAALIHGVTSWASFNVILERLAA